MPQKKTKLTESKKTTKKKAWTKPAPKPRFEPEPKDANIVNSIRARLQQIREYKKILAADGLKPDDDDKALESDLIVQLMRIEKGLPPKKPQKKKKKPKVTEKPASKPVAKGRRNA